MSTNIILLAGLGLLGIVIFIASRRWPERLLRNLWAERFCYRSLHRHRFEEKGTGSIPIGVCSRCGYWLPIQSEAKEEQPPLVENWTWPT